MNDRIRAKPPINDVDQWNKGQIENISSSNCGKTITVLNEKNNQIDLNVTKEVYELFVSRLDNKSVTGENVWYKKK